MINRLCYIVAPSGTCPLSVSLWFSKPRSKTSSESVECKKGFDRKTNSSLKKAHRWKSIARWVEVLRLKTNSSELSNFQVYTTSISPTGLPARTRIIFCLVFDRAKTGLPSPGNLTKTRPGHKSASASRSLQGSGAPLLELQLGTLQRGKTQQLSKPIHAALDHLRSRLRHRRQRRIVDLRETPARKRRKAGGESVAKKADDMPPRWTRGSM